MLMVVEKGKEDKVLKVFEKWDLPCSEIGHVTNDGILNFYMHGQLEASIPAAELVLGGGAPVYDRAFAEPTYLQEIENFNLSSVPVPKNMEEAMQIGKQLITLPSIASKKYIYEQYDSMVGTANTNTNNPSAAAVIAIKGTTKAVAITTDCNSRYVYANPRIGAMIAVCEAARNIVCSGGTPLGVTNCLNFGNPYNPEVYFQFKEAIIGMGDACRKLNTPVTGGNVSFYNQNPDGPVFPTPTIGMVGVLQDCNKKIGMGFQNAGQTIYLLGKNENCINSSQYLAKLKGVFNSPAPYFNLEEEATTMQIMRKLVDAGIVVSANDISEGGLFVALMESAFVNEIGFDIQLVSENRLDAELFGEAQGRYLVSVNTIDEEKLEELVSEIPYKKLGKTALVSATINGHLCGTILEWKTLHSTVIENMMNAN
jgi:phosphoribosylformylglycinamidine synthase